MKEGESMENLESTSENKDELKKPYVKPVLENLEDWPSTIGQFGSGTTN